MNSDIAISLKNVSKYYKLYKDPRDRLKEALSPFSKVFHKKFYATNNINLEIKKGEILGIVGKNGSGKSTLLKLITSVLTPDEGSIQVKGKISALLELGSGFNPEFTGLQNIFFYGAILGFSKKDMNEKLADIITFADIGEFIEQPLKTYSSGMKARLGFAVAVHIDPEILILDEVLSVGDVLFKRKSYAKMQGFFENGKTIIYVSHSTNEINRLCTRAIFLLNGEIIMDDEPKIVTKYYEKYLFAKKENQVKVIEEIKNLSYQVEPKLEVSLEKKEHLLDSFNIKNNETPLRVNSNRQKSFFIPGLISNNRTEYDNIFLDIYDVFIETLDEEKVNVLITNERYRFCYTLKFKKKYENIYYGMQVLTEKGVLISGSAFQEIPSKIKKNENIEVKWEFNCSMHIGNYFLNIAILDKERKHINRVVDAYAIKVISNMELENGLVYLQQSKPKIVRN